MVRIYYLKTIVLQCMKILLDLDTNVLIPYNYPNDKGIDGNQ